MEPPEISKILVDWAFAVKKDDDGKRRRASLSDLVKKYSHDAQSEIKEAIASKRCVRPWSHEDFTLRLHTFHRSAAWFAKPAVISPLECAIRGWCNSGIDELQCLNCSVKLLHSKDDHDGKSLLTLLSTGHSTICGWTDNFCPDEFLNFPVKSSVSFCTDLLLRVRVTLLAIAEFARNMHYSSTEEKTSNDGVTSSQQDTSNRTLKVQVGSAMFESTPALIQYLLDSSLQSTGDNGKLLEVALFPIASSSCRQHIAAAVEAIDVLLSSDNIDLSMQSQSVEDNAFPLFDALLLSRNKKRLLGAEDPRSPEDSAGEQVARQVVRMSILMSICGWNPVTGSASVNLSSAVQPVGSPLPAVNAMASSSAGVTLDSFSCESCGRCFPIKQLLFTNVDPLFQHRAFCLWAHSSPLGGLAGNGGEVGLSSASPGWEQCTAAAMSCHNDSAVVPDARRDSISNASRRRSASGLEGESGGRVSIWGGGISCGDAEEAYKKIKSVLDSATSPRLSFSGRLSL